MHKTTIVAVILALSLCLFAGIVRADGNDNGQGNNNDNNNNNNGGGHPSLSGYTTVGGTGILNWHASLTENKINVHNVGSLVQLWNYTLQQNMSFSAGTQGGWSSVPTSTGDNYVYATDWSGSLWAFNRFNGQVLWHYNVSQFLLGHLGASNPNEYCSRASPTIDGSNLYVTTRAGAYVLSLNRFNGHLNWATSLGGGNLFAVITNAVSVFGNMLYTGMASTMEQGALGGVPCCPFRGTFFALHTADGSVAWRAYMIPDPEGRADDWGGATVWSSLSPIDVERGQIIVSTGNLYSVPQHVEDCLEVRFNLSTKFISDPCRDANDFSESIVALDLYTGRVRWSRAVSELEVSTSFCGITLGGVTFLPSNPSQCPPADLGQDYDFGQSPMFIPAGESTPDGEDALVVCQKSGLCYAMSAQAGEMHWAVQAAPGGGNGGFEFGSATDGNTLFYGDCNSNARNFTLQNGQVLHGISHIGAIDIRTGHIIWETPLPVPYPGAGIMQGLTYANGVVYASSLSFLDLTPTGPYLGPNNTGGHFYALNAATGHILLDLKLDSKSCYPPSVVDGIVYVACGYNFDGGLFPLPATLYAYGVPSGNHGH